MEAFKYGCIVDGEYFCDRPKLSRQLAKYLDWQAEIAARDV